MALGVAIEKWGESKNAIIPQNVVATQVAFKFSKLVSHFPVLYSFCSILNNMCHVSNLLINDRSDL